ncbi:hypothetical protein QR680_015411 [Steinernema hermaphroditum]|uniref:Uncharacterized protein n=1 Tax=Steinernema hermaphroditum TaxID=289476 RepID=A0AA39H8I1_9BILA|nr:hypothetical protein QR680_015411 [Steinernema hermaphroditum]
MDVDQLERRLKIKISTHISQLLSESEHRYMFGHLADLPLSTEVRDNFEDIDVSVILFPSGLRHRIDTSTHFWTQFTESVLSLSNGLVKALIE